MATYTLLSIMYASSSYRLKDLVNLLYCTDVFTVLMVI